MEKGLLARIIFTKGFRIGISGLKQLNTRSGGIREYLTLRLAFFYQRPKNLREKKTTPFGIVYIGMKTERFLGASSSCSGGTPRWS